MDERTSQQSEWLILNRVFPKNHVSFYFQIILIYIIVISSIVNISINNGDKTLWCTLLASCMGYVLPNPSLKPAKTLQRSSSVA